MIEPHQSGGAGAPRPRAPHRLPSGNPRADVLLCRCTDQDTKIPTNIPTDESITAPDTLLSLIEEHLLEENERTLYHQT